MSENSNYSSGKFNNLIPYVRIGTGIKKIVFFMGGGHVFIPTNILIEKIRQNYCDYVSNDYTFYFIGYRSNINKNTTLDHLVNDFANVIRSISDSPVTIIGLSLGGMLGIKCVVKYPKLSNKLVLISASYTYSKNGLSFLRKGLKIARKGKKLLQFLRHAC